MTMSTCVGVFGAGSWGTALAIRLALNGHTVLLWGRDSDLLENIRRSQQNPVYLPDITLPDNIRVQTDLASTVSACEYLILSVPTSAIRPVLEQIVPEITGRHKGIICTAKGFEKDTGLTVYQLIDSIVRDTPSAYLSGPSFAAEVANGMPTAVTMASVYPDFAVAAAALFHNEAFRVYTNSDVVGVTIAGGLKNVIAIAAGIADGLAFGMNARAALITRGLSEIRAFACSLGAKDSTLYGLAGLGDLVLTCSDDQSRNRRLGLLIAQGETLQTIEKKLGQAIEGINTAEIICRLARESQIEMPICEQVNRILTGHIDARQAVQELLLRPSKSED